MKREFVPNGKAMEIGVAVFGVAVIGAVIALAAGRVMTGLSRAKGHAQSPPAPGTTPDERHHNVSVVAAR